MTQVIIWILPAILFFFGVMFFRKNVSDPKIARAWYLATPVFLIPIVGIILFIFLIGVGRATAVSGDIEWNEDSRFYKNWIVR